MKYRNLRIAWSVAWGLVALLLCVLWVRSYWINEALAVPSLGTRFHVQSLCGRIVFGQASNSVSFRQPVTDPLRKLVHKGENAFGFDFYRAGGGYDLVAVTIPSWFLISTTTILAAAPCIVRQFYLRTMLIATTLVAVVLEIAPWAVRR